MCGRFTLHSDVEKINARFGLSQSVDIIPSYNIAPSQSIQVVCEISNEASFGRRMMVAMRWGFIPFWATKVKLPAGIINARVETVDKKPAFRQAIRSRRCLVPADGFYEWKSGTTPKQPYYIFQKDNNIFGMAGIWTSWQTETEVIYSCAIVTVEANNVLLPIHARMPAIIEPKYYTEWLNPKNQETTHLKSLLKPTAPEDLALIPVSRKMNNVRYNHADCIEPIKNAIV